MVFGQRPQPFDKVDHQKKKKKMNKISSLCAERVRDLGNGNIY